MVTSTISSLSRYLAQFQPVAVIFELQQINNILTFKGLQFSRTYRPAELDWSQSSLL